ncbi:MAG: peptidylprolyl isomerase, partial [Candidatus Geothermincolia bacterium]
MGKAQKLKQQRRVEQERQEKARREKRRRRWRRSGVAVLAGVVLAGLIFGIFSLIPRYDQYRELVLETAKGEIRIELLISAPRISDRIAELAGQGFYDGVTFHRVLEGLAQTGDPTSKNPEAQNVGSGGSGVKLPIEIDFLAPGF